MIQSISPIQSLDVQIAQYQNPSIINALKTAKQSFPIFRTCRGDGNCFFRAAFFGYLQYLLIQGFFFENQTLSDVYQQLLARIIQNQIQYKIHHDSIPMEYRRGFQQQLITTELATNLIQLKENAKKKNSPTEITQQLTDLLNQNTYFDFCLIVLVRSLGIESYANNFKNYQPFKDENDNFDEENVLQTYGLEGQALILNLIADQLIISLNLVILFKGNQIKQEPRMPYEGNPLFQINLFFRPGHYDLIYDLKTYYRFNQKQQIIIEQNFYSNSIYQKEEKKDQKGIEIEQFETIKSLPQIQEEQYSLDVLLKQLNEDEALYDFLQKNRDHNQYIATEYCNIIEYINQFQLPPDDINIYSIYIRQNRNQGNYKVIVNLQKTYFYLLKFKQQKTTQNLHLFRHAIVLGDILFNQTKSQSVKTQQQIFQSLSYYKQLFETKQNQYKFFYGYFQEWTNNLKFDKQKSQKDEQIEINEINNQEQKKIYNYESEINGLQQQNSLDENSNCKIKTAIFIFLIFVLLLILFNLVPLQNQTSQGMIHHHNKRFIQIL